MEVFPLLCDCQIKYLNSKEKHADGKPFDYHMCVYIYIYIYICVYICVYTFIYFTKKFMYGAIIQVSFSITNSIY